MLEVHPFGNFVPRNARRLMLGSFTTKPMKGYEWFYANGRNQFWPIMESVYGTELTTKHLQQKLFTRLAMALSDIIYSCERKSNSNLDVNLINITYNIDGVDKIIRNNKIDTVYFTSRFVEKLFRKLFKKTLIDYPRIHLVTLPSPSPRYAQLTKKEKSEKYKNLLPALTG